MKNKQKEWHPATKPLTFNSLSTPSLPNIATELYNISNLVNHTTYNTYGEPTAPNLLHQSHLQRT